MAGAIAGPDLGGARLVVVVSGRSVGLPLDRVSEVISLGDMTPVPGAPAPVRGLVHLRGQLVPVVDLASAAFESAAVDPVAGAALVVVESRPSEQPIVRAALMVDRVIGMTAEAELELDVERTLGALRMERA